MKVKRVIFKKKHPKCPFCECEEIVKDLPRESDWRPGGIIVAWKKKNKEKYGYILSRSYVEVYRFMYEVKQNGTGSAADHDIVFETGRHQAGAVRCRLHQAGVIDEVGKVQINGETHTLWALNDRGVLIWEHMVAEYGL